MRYCEYGLPQLFSVVEMFAKRLSLVTNYSLFVAEMPRWFRAEVLKNLDEQGMPVQTCHANARCSKRETLSRAPGVYFGEVRACAMAARLNFAPKFAAL
jgi:hypothetical protein